MSIDEHEPTKEPQELSPEVIQVLAEVQGIFLQCLRAISETTAMLKVMQEFCSASAPMRQNWAN
jgi:hypothetical protein